MGDQLRRYHQQHVNRALAEPEDELLDVGRARRQVHHQAVHLFVPAGAGDQPVDEQLSQRRVQPEPLAFTDEEGGRSDLDAVAPGRLDPRPGRSRASEQRDVGGVLAATQP